jgi:hypothetical protein
MGRYVDPVQLPAYPDTRSQLIMRFWGNFLSSLQWWADQITMTVNQSVVPYYVNGVGIAVPANATSLTLSFSPALPAGVQYGVIAIPNWNTTVWITGKAQSGCTVNFGTAAPAGGGSIDYIVWLQSPLR